jgi:hypothetical protein
MRCLNKQPYFLCREEPTREYITVSMIILDVRPGENAAHIDTESHLQFSCKHRETAISASFTFCAKLGLFALSAVLGMVSFLVVKAKSTEVALNAPIAGVTIAMTYREVPFDAKQTLLAQTVNSVDIGGDAFGVLYILQKDGKSFEPTRMLEA